MLAGGARVWGAVEEGLAVLLLLAMTGLVLVQVVGRYVLTNPFIWTEEVTRLTLVWLTFVAGAAVTRRGLHIAVDMLLRPVPTRPRILIAGLTEWATAATFAWVAILGARLADGLGTLPLAATRWPMSVMIWPAVAGAALIALYAAIRGTDRVLAAALGRTPERHVAEFEDRVRT